MHIAELAQRIDIQGQTQCFIEDNELLRWSRENQLSPSAAQRRALGEGVIPLRYLKNFSALDLAEQSRICSASALVCGCGGLGGVLIDLLARAGAGKLRLVDGDVFVTSNLNRQWLSDTEQIGRPKAEVAGERVLAINPFTEVDVLYTTLTAENAQEIFQGIDLVLDALDNIEGRFLLYDVSRRFKIPLIHAAVAGWWGQISTFPPGSSLDLNSIYGGRRLRDPAEDLVGVLGPTASIIASLQAMEALRVLSGRIPAYSGRLLYFDGESGRTEIVPL